MAGEMICVTTISAILADAEENEQPLDEVVAAVQEYSRENSQDTPGTLRRAMFSRPVIRWVAKRALRAVQDDRESVGPEDGEIE